MGALPARRGRRFPIRDEATPSQSPSAVRWRVRDPPGLAALASRAACGNSMPVDIEGSSGRVGQQGVSTAVRTHVGVTARPVFWRAAAVRRPALRPRRIGFRLGHWLSESWLPVRCPHASDPSPLEGWITVGLKDPTRIPGKETPATTFNTVQRLYDAMPRHRPDPVLAHRQSRAHRATDYVSDAMKAARM